MENFCNPTTKYLDAIAKSVRGIYDALTVERCAQAMRVDPKTAYSYKNDQVIPVARLLALMAYSRDSGDPLAATEAHRIAGVFAEAAGSKVVSASVVNVVNQVAAALVNGGQLRDLGKGCPACGGELTLRGYHDNEPVYGCKKCRGVGLRA